MEFDDLWADKTLALSEVQEFTINTIRPPESLAPYINSFYTFRSESELIRDVQPASFGHVMFFLSGHGEARFFDGSVFPSHPISLIGPSNSAMQYIVKGPFYCVGIAFQPAGFFSFTGRNARESADQLVDGTTEIADPELSLLEKLRMLNAQALAGERDQQMFDLLASHIEDRFKPIKPKHGKAIKQMFEWLDGSMSPDLYDLYDAIDVSSRQMQRISNDYVGCAPKFLLRKYRAIRASMVLNEPDCDSAARDRLADLFYDQPHMIREINLFTGRTPKFIDGDTTPLLQMWFDRAKASEKSGLYPKISSNAE